MFLAYFFFFLLSFIYRLLSHVCVCVCIIFLYCLRETKYYGGEHTTYNDSFVFMFVFVRAYYIYSFMLISLLLLIFMEFILFLVRLKDRHFNAQPPNFHLKQKSKYRAISAYMIRFVHTVALIDVS